MPQQPNFKNPKDFNRHIIFDEIQKVIYIEIKTAINASPLNYEYNKVVSGDYYDYIPVAFRAQVAKVVGEGFRVVPFVAYGYAVGDTAVMSIVGINVKNTIGA